MRSLAVFKNVYIFLVALLNILTNALASTGDASPFNKKCLDSCKTNNCTNDGNDFKSNFHQPFVNKLMRWSCEDECTYECMWKTVSAFQARNWEIPQFHGKWPFVRFMGIQEPASAFFSLLNLYIHIKMLTKFRAKVRKDSPLYGLWNLFAYTCINAWIWSTVFHTRDVWWTEILDYICAFSMVLVFFYCLVIRLLRNAPRLLLIIITVIFLLFFFNHAVYLSTGKFSYSYNMKLNISIGSTTALIWFIWCLYNRKRQPYVMKCAIFVTLAVSTTLLEVMDFPPLFYVFDPHSLWHLSTAPLIPLVYSFIIDDCKYLRNLEEEKQKKKLV